MSVVVLVKDALPEAFITAVDQIDYTSPVTKINGMITDHLTLHFIELKMCFLIKKPVCKAAKEECWFCVNTPGSVIIILTLSKQTRPKIIHYAIEE